MLDERSLGDLLSNLSKNASFLVRQELRLVKVEMKEKVAKAGKEIALVGIAVFLANAALLSLVAALIIGLANVMDLWLAAFLVGALLAVTAAILAALGIRALKQINPKPERTLATLEEDKVWLQQQMS
jgi:uncharacterized membrane protein YqjE